MFIAHQVLPPPITYVIFRVYTQRCSCNCPRPVLRVDNLLICDLEGCFNVNLPISSRACDLDVSVSKSFWGVIPDDSDSGIVRVVSATEHTALDEDRVT